MHVAASTPLRRRKTDCLPWILSLKGDFHEDIRGTLIRLSNPNPSDRNDELGRSGYPQGNFRLIERYTPIDANTIHYEATVDDPTTWTKPFTYLMPWRREAHYRIYEYACHESNYGLRNALAAARHQEKLAAGAAEKSRR